MNRACIRWARGENGVESGETDGRHSDCLVACLQAQDDRCENGRNQALRAIRRPSRKGHACVTVT